MKWTAIAVVLLLVAAGCHDKWSAADPAASVSTRSEPVVKTVTDLHVVSLGDSLAYGAGDESGRGISGRLKDELRQRGVTNVETVNLGMNGAQTSDVLGRLKQERTRAALLEADAVVLSIGANDLFRTQASREEVMRNPLAVAERILSRIEQIVMEIHRIKPDARVLILGGYNPVPNHSLATTIDEYLGLWDVALAARFEKDRRVSVVKMSDIVTRQRLSRHDSFHPGSDAYAEAARRIAGMLASA